ncbi:MAG TPA: glycosyl hydrolase 53 family protein, partial [Lacipirellulaceae bacterium]|nr:glycosyl hydrolase 53 family protein [Lacipirellulaceae bacterium]
MFWRTANIVAVAWLAGAAGARGLEFMAGADISALPVLEGNNAVYRANGVAGDVVEMFSDRGVNWFRLRLFVDPSQSSDPFVKNDLDYTLALAQRVKAVGGKLLLDFHYSDSWADPGKQTKPAAWANLNFTNLTTRVHDYTRDAVAAFKAAGVLPEMVQIGNEISNGMLWQDGYVWTGGSHSTGFNRLASLLTACINGAKAGAGPGDEPLVMIHHDKGADWNTSRFFFDQLRDRSVDFDVIGYSYYPKFHYNPNTGAGGIDALRSTLANTADRYGKPVVLVETGFASRGQQFEPTYEFPVSVAGQRQFLEAVIEAVQDVPHDLGRGVFWWYPEARPSSGLPVWEGGRYGWFDANGNLLPTIEALAGLNPPPTPGDYNGDGTVDGDDLAAWTAQLWQTGAGLPADGDGNGLVDGADFLLWQR